MKVFKCVLCPFYLYGSVTVEKQGSKPGLTLKPELFYLGSVLFAL